MGMLGEPKFPGITAWIPWKGHSRVVFFRFPEDLKESGIILFCCGVQGLVSVPWKGKNIPKFWEFLAWRSRELKDLRRKGKGRKEIPVP